jgi:hypothetical protein
MLLQNKRVSENIPQLQIFTLVHIVANTHAHRTLSEAEKSLPRSIQRVEVSYADKTKLTRNRPEQVSRSWQSVGANKGCDDTIAGSAAFDAARAADGEEVSAR